MNQMLKDICFDPELSPGARNAVQVCLKIKPSEKVTLITDNVSKEIAASIVNELESLGCRYRIWVLEELATRPLQSIPREILEDLETSQVSVFAVHAQPNELRSRMQMTEMVTRRKIRHAHMVNINAQIMREGMRADFVKVDKISTRVWEIVSSAQTIRAKTPAGTNLSAELMKGTAGSRPVASSAPINGVTCQEARCLQPRSKWMGPLSSMEWLEIICVTSLVICKMSL